MAGMKLALLSDIHANLPALRACVAHAHAQGATGFALLGDLVGYGAEPAAVLDAVIALAGAGAIVLRGNHDAAALAPGGDARSAEQVSAQWTHERLAPAHAGFLGSLPTTAVVEGVLLVHASAHEPQAWHYVDGPQQAAQCVAAAMESHGVARVVCGHVHHQRLFYPGRAGRLMAFDPTPGVAVPLARRHSWVATIGAVGQPRDGDPRAMYALLEAEPLRLTFHRVAYDHCAASAAIRRSTLPASFADRLERAQ